MLRLFYSFLLLWQFVFLFFLQLLDWVHRSSDRTEISFHSFWTHSPFFFRFIDCKSNHPHIGSPLSSKHPILPLPPPWRHAYMPSPPVSNAPPLSYTLHQVKKALKVRKATGPEGISPSLLRECADQLSEVLLVPKTSILDRHNGEDCPRLPPHPDGLQFAYQPGTGVDDPLNYLLHWALCHLKRSGVAVKIMFF